MSLYFAALVRLWEASHRQFSFALSCSSLNEGGMHPTGNLLLHLRMEVRALKASQDYPMWFLHSHHKHVLYIFYVECPFTKLILKPVSALPSPNITCLVIVPFSFRLSFGATKKQFPKMVRVLAGTVEVHSKCCHVGLKSQILRQTKKLPLRVRKCNLPLTFLSVHL